MHTENALNNASGDQRLLTPYREPLVPLEGANVFVIGAARCGVAAASLLLRAGVSVTLSDIKERLSQDALNLEELGATLQTGTQEIPKGTNLVVRSPGVPRNVQVMKDAYESGIPVVSEIELASWFCDTPIIAVTGTDGKSSVVTMINEALLGMGIKSVESGNIGTPFCRIVQEDSSKELDYVVVEVSSYALEDIHSFSPHIAVLLNVAEDHLDHYESFDEYTEVKGRIGNGQKADDYFILNAADERCLRFRNTTDATKLFFSLEDHAQEGAFLFEDYIVYRQEGNECRIDVNLENWLRHQKENYLAALIVCERCGADLEEAAEALSKFKGLPHRIQFVRKLRGVAFYDDSKATSVHATTAALNSIEDPIVLIAGGDAKGADFRSLKPLVREKVKAMVLLGTSKDQLAETFGDCVTCEKVNDLEEAVEEAVKQAEAGDIVLLSPACSSLDMFANFEERGRVFQQAVMELD